MTCAVIMEEDANSAGQVIKAGDAKRGNSLREFRWMKPRKSVAWINRWVLKVYNEVRSYEELGDRSYFRMKLDIWGYGNGLLKLKMNGGGAINDDISRNWKLFWRRGLFFNPLKYYRQYIFNRHISEQNKILEEKTWSDFTKIAKKKLRGGAKIESAWWCQRKWKVVLEAGQSFLSFLFYLRCIAFFV